MRTFAAALLLLALAAAPTSADEVTGPPTVVSGDLLEVGGQRLRLAGIDAPEPGQSCRLSDRSYDCGRISATALMDLTAGVEVRCAAEPAAADGRPALATCFAGDYDLSEGMVYTGWALADPESGGRYKRLETGAKKARRGLWRGSFEPPWVWRARQEQ